MSDTSPPSDRASRDLWLLREEGRLARKAGRALAAIVQWCVDSFSSTIVASAQGDLAAFDPIPDAWITFLRDELVDEFGNLYQAGQMTAWLGLPIEPSEVFARSWTAVANERAQSYIVEATNRLASTGESTWRLVRAEVDRSMREGFTIEGLRDKVQDVTRFSTARAETIARTETIGAYVQGDMAGAQALGELGPIEKVWVATLDRRTRESHAAAHDQVRLMSEHFDVGGVAMDSPHDTSAPAGEVVNCRCYVEFLYVGQARPDGSLVEDLPHRVPSGQLSLVE